MNVKKITPKARAIIAKYQNNPAAIAEYLNDALLKGDAVRITIAIGDMIRAQGATVVARRAGQHRESLYRMFSSEKGPALATAIAVLQALGIQLIAKPSVLGELGLKAKNEEPPTPSQRRQKPSH